MGFYYGPSEQDLQAAEDFLEHQRDEWERRRFDWSAELEDPDWRVRVDALVELSQLEPEDIETHADAILSCLNDSNANVRVRACETLRSLDLNPEIFMRYVCDGRRKRRRQHTAHSNREDIHPARGEGRGEGERAGFLPHAKSSRR